MVDKQEAIHTGNAFNNTMHNIGHAIAEGGRSLEHGVGKAAHSAEHAAQGLSAEMAAKFKAMEPNLHKIMESVREKMALHNVADHHNFSANVGFSNHQASKSTGRE